MGPGFDQETHQACGFSRVESVDTKNPQHIGRFKCTFLIGSHFPLCYFHIPQESISRLNYVLLGTDAHTTQPGRAASASPTHRTYCSSLLCPALSLQPYTPAGRAGKGLPREPFIMVINALCFTKFHQSSRPHRSKAIILYAFFFFFLY